MVQMGNIYNIERQNAVYITSTDDCGPYIDVLAGLNRPDYSVLYVTPTWATKKANIKKKGDIYVREDASDFYYQTTNPGSVNPDNFGGKIDKKHPLIFLKTKDKNQVLINDGENNQITQEILNNPAEYGYFLTEVPTIDSALLFRNKEYKCTYTKITKVRLGNLSGIHNEIFGTKQPYGYGLYGENVFLTGEFYLNNGTSIVDFSEESILLKFRNAGLEIRDVVNEDGTIDQVPALNLEGEPILDENGNPTYRNKTEIYMNADQFVFSIAGNPAMKLSGLFNDKGQFQEALLDVQGAVQSRGLRVHGTEMSSRPPFTWDPDLEIHIDAAGDYVTQEGYYINSFINTKGNLYARDGYFKGKIYATSGYFSGEINAESGKIGDFVIEQNSTTTGAWIWDTNPYVLYQKYGQTDFMGSRYQQGFKFGVGKRRLFDNYGGFLEIYTQYNSFVDDVRDAIGIKVSGNHIVGIFSSSHSGIKYGSENDPITYPLDVEANPNNPHTVAGFFDGNLWCTSGVHASIYTTKCIQSEGMISYDAYGHAISNDGKQAPVAGNYYGGWTGRLTHFDRAGKRGRYHINVVNGLIVGWQNE